MTSWLTLNGPDKNKKIQEAFIFTMATSAVDEIVTLPATSELNNFTIDWGDGTTETVTSISPSHVYATAGDYEISIYGTCTVMSFKSNTQLTSVSNLGSTGLTTCYQMFYGCSNLISFECGDCDTSLVTNMNYMFRDCSGLTSLDVSSFDTSLVTGMYYMFRDCSGLTSLDVSSFDTSLVTDMYSMFKGCSGLTSLDVSSFDTSLVTDMYDIFYDMYDISYNVIITNTNYDALLASWSSHSNQTGISLNVGSAQYTESDARSILIDTYGWSITDGGLAA